MLPVSRGNISLSLVDSERVLSKELPAYLPTSKSKKIHSRADNANSHYATRLMNTNAARFAINTPKTKVSAVVDTVQ